MAFELIDTFTIYEDSAPDGNGAWFPGIARLSADKLLVTFSTGQEFEGEHLMAFSVSEDNGRSWQFGGTMFGGTVCGNMKPAVLRDKTIAATGYKFDLQDGLLVNPETGGLAPGGNYIAYSHDGGNSWSMPEKIDTGLPEVVETSGPCIELDNGDLIAPCTPFPRWDGTMPSGRKGFILRSCDKGRSWNNDAVFFRTPSGNVAPYETRIAQLPGGRIVIMIWCLDEKAGKSLNNHAVYSDDGGKSWSKPLDTQMPAQASNIFPLADDTLLAVHCVREGDCGVYLTHVKLAVDQWQTLQKNKIWDAASAKRIGSLTDMGENLKFGQPSVISLSADTFLVIHWAMSGRKGRILGHRIKFDFQAMSPIL